MQQPVARVDIVQDTYFGIAIADPYRWMEDWKGAELKEWVEAQGVATRRLLDAIPGRSSLLAEISDLGNATPTLRRFQLAGDRAFYLRLDPGENLPKLVVRRGRDAPEQILVDPNRLAGPVHTAIDWFAPSHDGHSVAYGSSQGGSEESTLRMIDVDRSETLDLAINRMNYGIVSWLDDNRSFIYHRLREQPADEVEADRYKDSRSYLHQFGTEPERDPAVFGRGINPAVEMAPDDIPAVVVSADGRWLIGMVIHGVLNELTLYAAPRAALDSPATCAWTKVADVADAVTGFDVAGETIYLLTHKAAPRFKVIATALPQPDLATAAVVVPEGHAVIREIKVAGQALLTRDLDGGIWRMRRVALGGAGAPIEEVELPVTGTITAWTNSQGGAEVLLELMSWTVSPRIYRYDADGGTLQDTGWQPSSPIDFSAIEAHEAQAPSADGTLVPLSIIHKRGLVRDGSNPTLLMGYGSYGITIDPFFGPQMRAWYDRGGVFAIAHLRGGGEYGEAWHVAGQKRNKQTTIDDFIACGEYLIAQHYTRAERLAGEGTSAGGIPSSGALVRRPDLWAVMVIRVGVTNALRSEVSENGPPNIPEFGSVAREEEFEGLRIMDAYTRVQDNTPYPAVLLTTGLNDPRVVVWQATKMAARLQAATSSGKPVLLRVEAQGGHGMGSTKHQLDEELTDRLAFLLHQFGLAL